MNPQKIIWNKHNEDHYEGIVLPDTIEGIMESARINQSSTFTNCWTSTILTLKLWRYIHMYMPFGQEIQLKL